MFFHLDFVVRRQHGYQRDSENQRANEAKTQNTHANSRYSAGAFQPKAMPENHEQVAPRTVAVAMGPARRSASEGTCGAAMPLFAKVANYGSGSILATWIVLVTSSTVPVTFTFLPSKPWAFF